MTRVFASALVFALIGSSACKKEEPAPAPSVPDAEVAVAPEDAAMPTPEAENMAGDKERRMANCPTAVGGATATVNQEADHVVITVVAKDEKAVSEIRSRAAKLVESAKASSDTVKHTGGGTGGGASGYCPVVLANTTITAEDTEGGSKITVKPAEGGNIDDLRKMTEDRAKFAMANQNMGGGKDRKMANCPSAVEGSETKSEETDGGVTLTVTAADAKAAKDIQARAKKLAASAKADAGKKAGAHTGGGTGGGSEGFCPVVLAGTTLEVKDIDNGVTIAVKADNGDHVDMLRMMTKERLETKADAAAPSP